ncbi:MAG: hypothetical protein J6C19_11620 [Lachnospiraceae bacterium]|nr:hypothetical protein [Lachnospiraceae bacterium]MBO5292077.1 hypothetical protein [Lachnospiraceae bacterium]
MKAEKDVKYKQKEGQKAAVNQSKIPVNSIYLEASRTMRRMARIEHDNNVR